MPQLNSASLPEEVLRHTVITDEAPGTILHDFQVLLDFVIEESPQLTDALMLPMKALPLLNERLTRRIEHRLARAQQKSYPHINGLYLLLRASGLTLVDTTGRKPVLVVDPTVADSWSKLNADERYFTLLESWLLRGDSEIIGERGGLLAFRPPLYLWAEFFQTLERHDRYEGDWIELVRYWPGLHHLALMELFGLVTIEDAAAQPGKGWQIANIQETEWGEALLILLASKLLDNWGFWEKVSRPHENHFGELQPLIQPYRPGWKKMLQFPERGFQEGLFIFKVSLDKDLWRQITIPAQNTLDELSDAILEAYRFDHDHLYRFLYPTRFGVTAEALHPYMDERPHADEVRIGDLPIYPGFQMIYNYDFGDDWRFHVLLERIDPPNPKVKGYRISKRQGKSPEQYPTWDESELDDY